MPWWDSGASGGAAWPWLGAALAKTTNISIGTGVTAPILRYHSPIVAQVFATLGFMFPNRVFLGIGRGEAINEVTSGQHWPSNAEKFARLAKRFNPYVRRHSALTEKSIKLKSNILNQHAGLSMRSNMAQKYIHYFGNESSDSLLELILYSGLQQFNEGEEYMC